MTAKALGLRWIVRCAEFDVEVRGDRATAERRLEAIERLGACLHPHEIVPSE